MYTDLVIDDNNLVINTNQTNDDLKIKQIKLTKNEYRLLKALLMKKGEVISRNELMNVLWQTDIYIDENTLTVNINRLRKKLELNGISNYILTKKGFGYYVE